MRSHPVWVCGLKQEHPGEGIREGRSHPVWVCGLKPHQHSFANGSLPSHPVWVCGLKQAGQRTGVHQGRHTLYGCVD